MKIKNNSTMRSVFFIRCLSLSLFVIFFCQCSNRPNRNINHTSTINTIAINNSIDDTAPLPFIGIRYFETRPGVSGTGTPSWYVQIKNNRDVTFFYVQINQGSDNKTETVGKFYAGKYSKYIWCNFNEWDNFPRCFEITNNNIYEVDSSFRRLSLQECCGINDFDSSTCICDGEFWDLDEDHFKYIDSIFQFNLPAEPS